MTIRLHNTMTRSTEVFVPQDPTNVRMYVCGPTVYDDAHIGNARPVIVFDVLFRLLRATYGEGAVTYARNITDVDDKINERAARDYPGTPLNDAIRILTEKTEARFAADIQELGTLPPSHQPRATDNIAGMQEIILRLVDRGHAYVHGGEVLFSVATMPDYGKLSCRDLSAQRGGARIAVGDHKRAAADFVLWKASSPEEPGWESPWGRGRPGWHIECSAMSARYLGETFDIHGGGHDLIFPHHENEIAQSRCAHGTSAMANYWLHNGFVMLDGRKMSKSEGNFITMNQLLRTDSYGGRSWNGGILRLAMLMTSYREPLDFTARRLLEAENLISAWPLVEETDAAPDADVLECLSDDLDTVGAAKALHALAQKARRSDDALEAFSASAGLVGLGRPSPRLSAELVDEIERLVEERTRFVRVSDWAAADAVRNRLSGLGVSVADHRDPETGERRSRWSVVDPSLLLATSSPASVLTRTP
ncbi:cysteine--tRNA ligase [Pararhizobium sp. BT-229]|uniref:cysteine--tRNA ligase n=1 Tax=Pararhizobium sp. BT-229 TaxID=2986923 RepID=UPI0021F7F46E|nr:cysteine--tRNA ligase [Pararhizobium sp. BT-229]MCV9963672.1 cysteine--tRNA ligase [Pararhizobium sp. BT-229]